jgi:hypothetical protein
LEARKLRPAVRKENKSPLATAQYWRFPYRHHHAHVFAKFPSMTAAYSGTSGKGKAVGSLTRLNLAHPQVSAGVKNEHLGWPEQDI